jgi:hypothetical protein
MKRHIIESHPLISPHVITNFCLRCDERTFDKPTRATAARLYALVQALPMLPAADLLALAESRGTYWVERDASGALIGIMEIPDDENIT